MSILRFAPLLFNDVRHSLRRRLGLRLLIVLVLASGLVLFNFTASLLDGLFGDPPSVIDAQALYVVARGEGGVSRGNALAGEDILALRQRASSLSQLVATRWVEFNLSDAETARQADGLWVDGDLFGTLDWPVPLGRNFGPADFSPGAAPALILSDALWRSEYAADPTLIGRQLIVDGEPATVVGVLGPDLSFPFQQDLYLSTRLQDHPDTLQLDWSSLLRLQDDSERAAIESMLANFQAERVARLGADAEREPITLSLWWNNVTQPEAQLLMAALALLVWLVLLLAATNAGGLQLVLWIGRGRELATRSALGQPLARSIAMLFSEALILALLALAVALPCSLFLLGEMQHYLHHSENGMPRYVKLELSTTVWLWTVASTLLAALLLVWPSLRRLRRGDLTPKLRSGDRGNAGGLHGLSRGLLGLQCALACITVVVALVCAEGARRELSRPLGFDGDPLLTASFGFADAERQARFARQLRQAAAELPGVEVASLAGGLPIGLVPQRQIKHAEARLQVDYLPADEHSAAAWGLTLRQGSWFGAADVAQANRVAVIDQTLADSLFNGDAIGRTLQLEDRRWGEQPLTVIGVVQATRTSIGGGDRATLFTPLMIDAGYGLTLSLRNLGPADSQRQALAELARRIDPAIALVDLRSFAQLRWEAASWTRMILSLFAPVGALAMLLAATALSALLGFVISQREREIGIRRALGASAGQIGSALLRRLRLPAALGCALGLALALGLAMPIASGIYTDPDIAPGALLLALLPMGLALGTASFWPLRRALRIEAAVALRGD